MALGPVDLDWQQLDMGLYKSKHQPETEYDLFLPPPQRLLATRADCRRASVPTHCCHGSLRDITDTRSGHHDMLG